MTIYYPAVDDAAARSGIRDSATSVAPMLCTRAMSAEPTASRDHTIAEVAAIVGCSASTITRRIRAGDIRAYRCGPRTVRIPTVEVARLRSAPAHAAT